MKKLLFVSTAVAFTIVASSFSAKYTAVVAEPDARCILANDEKCKVVIEVEVEEGETGELEVTLNNRKRKEP
ncbi:hypothetical protein [Gynurincola endophyticus]|uniref:hypothetical protein n=1 Tax=Gynurincola endophyticus TaxID=2479004 RepID=UPI000F8CDA0A|nr:hypothetical protein [Gynurincola endophyticus]